MFFPILSLNNCFSNSCPGMAVGGTSSAFIGPKYHSSLEMRGPIYQTQHHCGLSCLKGYLNTSCSWSTGGRWRLSRDDRIVHKVIWQERSEPGQSAKTRHNTVTVASSPSGIRIKVEFLPWDFSEQCFPKRFTALDGKEILQACGEC